MKKIEQTEQYEQLQYEIQVIELIHELRCARELLTPKKDTSIDKTVYARYIEKYSNLIARIEKLMRAQLRGEVYLGTVSVGYSNVRDLIEMSKSDKKRLEDTLTKLSLLSGSCKNISSLPIELMEFYRTTHTYFSEDFASNLKRKISTLLRALPYDHTSNEGKYLFTNCPYIEWYEAYFFENPTVPDTENDFLANQLLLEATTMGNYPEAQLRLHFSGCVTLDDTILISILRANRHDIRRNAQQSLSLIREMGVPLPFDLSDYINARLDEIDTSEIQFIQLSNMFEGLVRLASEEEWMASFCNKLRILTNGDNLAKCLSAYLDGYAKNGASKRKGIDYEALSRLFKETYDSKDIPRTHKIEPVDKK